MGLHALIRQFTEPDPDWTPPTSEVAYADLSNAPQATGRKARSGLIPRRVGDRPLAAGSGQCRPGSIEGCLLQIAPSHAAWIRRAGFRRVTTDPVSATPYAAAIQLTPMISAPP